jgi:hypothetical protein
MLRETSSEAVISSPVQSLVNAIQSTGLQANGSVLAHFTIRLRDHTANRHESRFAGCSKSPSSKAAGESKPEAYPLRYVEDFDDPRTKLAGFFSILILLAVRWARVAPRSDG